MVSALLAIIHGRHGEMTEEKKKAPLPRFSLTFKNLGAAESPSSLSQWGSRKSFNLNAGPEKEGNL